MKKCPNCGLEYADNVRFCCECGSALTPSKIVCPSCGAEYETQQKFCSNCGSPLSAGSPAQKTMDDLKAKLLAAKKVSEMPAEHVAKSYLVYDSKGEHTFSVKIEGLDLQEGALLTSIQKDVEVTYENGGVYVGRLYEGYRHGQGKEIWPDGTSYEGEWRKGKRNGIGKQGFLDGAVYEGEWKDGFFNGKGKYVSVDGDVYDGGWRDGEFIL